MVLLIAGAAQRYRERSQTECTIECRGQFEQSQCRSAQDERGLSIRAAVGQMANVVRRYQDEVVIRTEEHRTEHG